VRRTTATAVDEATGELFDDSKSADMVGMEEILPDGR
jgi:hypothetical protein